MATLKNNRRSKELESLVRQNCRLARSLWSDEIRPVHLSELKRLSSDSGLSVVSGEVLLLNGRWYVTSAGLLRLAQEYRCRGIHTHAVVRLCDTQNDRWVFKATVYKSSRSKFVGYGDANPSNTSPLVRGAEMRVAETRAVNRALRKAYGIGLCSVEELGSFFGASQSFAAFPHSNGHQGSNGSGNGRPRLRDQLCLLIRQHNLDASLVKAYAADFCGTATLKEASRDLVESFISELGTAAKTDRDSLLCKLNSYAQAHEVKL
jgi:hypothetical protein